MLRPRFTLLKKTSRLLQDKGECDWFRIRPACPELDLGPNAQQICRGGLLFSLNSRRLLQKKPGRSPRALFSLFETEEDQAVPVLPVLPLIQPQPKLSQERVVRSINTYPILASSQSLGNACEQLFRPTREFAAPLKLTRGIH